MTDRCEAFAARVERLEHFEGGSFREMVEIVGLSPSKDLCFHNWSGCRLDQQDLRNFDFTGCNLAGSSFKSARILGAKFDLARVRSGQLGKAHDFRAWLKADLARKNRRRIDASRLRDLQAFREAPFAPEMVVIPAGEFWMGSDDSDDEASRDEKGPGERKRLMRVPERFALGKFPVTFEEYDLFCDETDRKRPGDEDWGRERRPVINVSWDDANAYAAWLNEKLGEGAYRLPSEAEWEYACRAGTPTRRWWGDGWDPSQANGERKFEGGRTSPVDHFAANLWGLHDMIGNVWEWCADVWVDSLADLPEDGHPYEPSTGRAAKSQKNKVNSSDRALRGGSWSSNPRVLRSAFRIGNGADIRYYDFGFRLARTL